VYSKTREEHLRHIKMVLNTLQRQTLLINMKKCNFMKKDLIYLGFVILRMA
jgi:hypothetical protein